MPTPSAEFTMAQEVEQLRGEVRSSLQTLQATFDARFTGLEKWLERVSTALEKQAESRERLIVLETRQLEQTRRHDELEKRFDEHRRASDADRATMREQLIKYGVYFAGALAVLTLAAPVLLKKFFGV